MDRLLDDAISRAAVHGVITFAALLGLGLTASAIRHREATGRLHRLHRGVYAVGDPRLTREGEWVAAVRAAGTRAALSHDSASVSWELERDGGMPPHVSVPGRSGRENDEERGYVIHRPATLPASAVLTRFGIPITTPERTIVDLSARRDDDRLLAVVGTASRRRLVDLAAFHAQLDDALRSRPSSKHLARVRNLLRVHAPELYLSESELERLFMTLCARRGIELPDQQMWIGRARVDFRWERARLVVEVDGYETHGTIGAMNADFARQRRLTLAGWTVLRFTWSDVAHRADATAADVAKALASY